MSFDLTGGTTDVTTKPRLRRRSEVPAHTATIAQTAIKFNPPPIKSGRAHELPLGGEARRRRYITVGVVLAQRSATFVQRMAGTAPRAAF